ncbi:lyase family protein [Pseudonocardia phyllosphaerae]|uniref:lyase family protein n=1 Tax=Pseudonocardia phyllosphaerae TaxID=3390502 RepID=UPI003979BB72
MTSLWWPGDHRAGDLLTDDALFGALVAVEQAWLDALVGTGVAPAAAACDLAAVAATVDPERIAVAAESGGTPVMTLVAALRAGAPDPPSAWLHRGLTSQDVLDTAVVLCARDAVAAIRAELGAQVTRLAELAFTHRDTPAVARTLTQPALPTTFGAKVAGWLHGVLDADAALAAIARPVQLGGAAGTNAALVELAGSRAGDVRRSFATALGLDPVPPWHTTRTTTTRLGDAAVTVTDALGRIARDVLQLGRAEVGEVVDGSAGGSSTMPHKANPTLSVLVRRAALAAPGLASTLHLAAADQVDERADGAWHAEWPTLAVLLRRTVVAAAQSTALLDVLVVRPDVMARRLADSGDTLLAEQQAMAALAGHDPGETYTGLAAEIVDEALARAAGHPAYLQEDTR